MVHLVGRSAPVLFVCALTVLLMIGAPFNGVLAATSHAPAGGDGAWEAITYADSPALNITSDAALAENATSGSGALNDPYVISGLFVNGLGGPICIRVSGTTAHFIITGNEMVGANAVDSNSQCYGAGVAIDGVADGTATIAGNFIRECTYGVCIQNTGNITVRDNHFLDMDYDSIKLIAGSHHQVLVGNLIESSGRHGVYLYSDTADGNHIFQNTILGSGFYGIYVDQGDNNTIHGNLVEGSNQWAVSLASADDNTVVANEFRLNGGSGSSLVVGYYQARDDGDRNRFGAIINGVWTGNYWQDLSDQPVLDNGTVGTAYPVVGNSDPYPSAIPINHAPMSIGVSDESLVAEMARLECWEGDGSATDPYVWANWTINAQGGLFGISVIGTSSWTDPVDIRVVGANVTNARMTSPTYHGAAVHIEDVGENASGPIDGRISLERVNCSKSIEGVRVNGAIGLVLHDSDISHNRVKGVYGTGMRWSVIANNSISHNGGSGAQAVGIHLFWNEGPLQVIGNEVHDTFSIRENGSSTGVEVKGIFSTSNTDINIVDNVVRDNYLVDTDLSLVSNSNSRVYGIHTLSDTRPVIMGNDVSGNEALATMDSSYARTYMYAINMADGEDAVLQDNDIHDNVILASKWAYVYTVQVQTSPNVIISGNTISGNSALNPAASNYSGMHGLYIMNCDRPMVIGNEISHNIKVSSTGISVGIYMVSVGNATLEGNVISSNNFTEGEHACIPSGMGMYLNNGVNDCRISANEISYNYAQAVYFSASTNRNELFLNVFDHNALTTDTYDPINPQCVDVSSSNAWYHTTDLMGNLWTDWTLPDADGDDIVDDPYVMDEPAGDDLYPLTGVVARATAPSVQMFNGSVQLVWSAPMYVLYGDDARYEVQRSVNGSVFSLQNTTGTTSYMEAFPVGAVDAVYRIVAVTDHGRAPPSEEAELSEITPPYVRITSPGDGAVIGTTHAAITWEGGDNESGIDHYEVKVDSAGWTDVGMALSCDTGSLAEGAHTVQVRAAANRTNQASDAVSFEISISLELVIFAPSASETFPPGQVEAEWQGWNNDSSIARYEVRVDSGTWVDVGTNTTYVITGLSEGEHTFGVRVWDALSNQLASSVSFTVSVPPEVIITSPLPGQAFEMVDVQASWQGWDNGSGLARYEVSVDSTSWTDVGLDTVYTMSGLSEGAHTFTVRAIDLLSNEVTVSVDFVVDGDPWVEVQCPAALINTTSLEISWTAHDNQSSVVGYEVSVDSGTWVDVGANTTYVITGLSEGEHTFSVRAWDAVGNNATAQRSFTVDITTPTVVSSTPNDDDAALLPLVTMVFSEVMDTTTVNVSGVEGNIVWEGTTLSIQVNEDLEPATTYQLRVNGKDLAGNAMEEFRFNFTTTDGMAVFNGHIQDDQGDPIPGVLVECSNGDTATTDTNGDFQFTLAPGTYSFDATKEGYEALSMEIVLEFGEEEYVVRTMGSESEGGGGSGSLLIVIAVALIALVAVVSYVIWRRKG